ncbi:MAG: hypothetical protein R3D53_14170 [Paracoccaceae bacterium]
MDSTNRMENSPFTPERSGGLPPIPLIELCYSGKYEKATGGRHAAGAGSSPIWAGDIRKAEAMAAAGDATRRAGAGCDGRTAKAIEARRRRCWTSAPPPSC